MVIFRLSFLFLGIKIRNHVAKGAEKAAQAASYCLKEGGNIFGQIPFLILIYRVQHQDKREQKDTAFVQKKQLRGACSAVGYSEQYNTNHVKKTVFFAWNP